MNTSAMALSTHRINFFWVLTAMLGCEQERITNPQLINKLIEAREGQFVSDLKMLLNGVLWWWCLAARSCHHCLGGPQQHQFWLCLCLFRIGNIFMQFKIQKALSYDTFLIYRESPLADLLLPSSAPSGSDSFSVQFPVTFIITEVHIVVLLSFLYAVEGYCPHFSTPWFLPTPRFIEV